VNIRTHNGIVTVRNPNTGEHRTFKVATQPFQAKFAAGRRIVYLLTGPDNESDWQGWGFVNEFGIRPWQRFGDVYRKYASLLWNQEAAESAWGMEFMWAARCRICNRTLTTPESIESGIGPVCAERVA